MDDPYRGSKVVDLQKQIDDLQKADRVADERLQRIEHSEHTVKPLRQLFYLLAAIVLSLYLGSLLGFCQHAQRLEVLELVVCGEEGECR